MDHLNTGLAEEFDLVIVRLLIIRRDQNDPPRLERAERAPDRGCRCGRARRAGAHHRGQDALLAAFALLHRIRGAVEGDHVAFRVGERAGRLLDARQELIKRAAIGAGHAQARDVHVHALRKRWDHLLLDHAVRGRNDKANTHCHGVHTIDFYYRMSPSPRLRRDGKH